MANKKDEIAVSQPQGLSNELADLANEFAGQGLVTVRSEIIRVPRLKLAQALSPAVSGGLTKSGNFFCELTGQDLGSEINFIPVIVSTSASLLNKAGEVVCRSKDLIRNQDGDKCSSCPHGQYWNDWGTKENKKVPLCKESFDFLALVDGVATPVVFSFRKTSIKAGKALVNYISFDPARVPFGTVYTLKSIVRENEAKQKYYTVDENAIARNQIPHDKLKELLPTIRNIISNHKANKFEAEPENSDLEY